MRYNNIFKNAWGSLHYGYDALIYIERFTEWIQFKDAKTALHHLEEILHYFLKVMARVDISDPSVPPYLQEACAAFRGELEPLLRDIDGFSWLHMAVLRALNSVELIQARGDTTVKL